MHGALAEWLPSPLSCPSIFSPFVNRFTARSLLSWQTCMICCLSRTRPQSEEVSFPVHPSAWLRDLLQVLCTLPFISVSLPYVTIVADASSTWKDGTDSGAFKRVMTASYTYLLTVPLILVYALGFAVIKYRQGFIEFENGMIPKPYTLWPEEERRAIFPLMLTFSVGWGLGMCNITSGRTLFLALPREFSAAKLVQYPIFPYLGCRLRRGGHIYAAPNRLDEVRTLKGASCEAYTFLGGSVSSLLLTLAFVPILWVFPRFLTNLKREGVSADTIIRLTKFHEFNIIRTIFRFIFVVPFVILGVDGVRPHAHVNESMLWTDFLIMMGSFGCCISALTLVIFFPRSVESEMESKDAARQGKHSRRRERLTSKRRPNDVSTAADISPYGFSPTEYHNFGSLIAPPESIHKGVQLCGGTAASLSRLSQRFHAGLSFPPR
ncbi:hypothetical protein MSAN_00281300 [Mycena sanguinolenta]|uniref:Uncharacterized protein n=1 Tax=Mycena sanguinolenta TaxID=230812 RepID=A0A8H6ZAL7_9AGAR|nr:hypothetical protein MSAN_00281300 [Mycena sanguinolenta]